MTDKYTIEMRKAIKDSYTNEQIDTILSKIYDDGFQDGTNEGEEE